LSRALLRLRWRIPTSLHKLHGPFILLAMQIDPVAEWRRLTEHYRRMSDVQIEELARDFADLTDTARQVLRDELRHRGLDCGLDLDRILSDSMSAHACAASSATMSYSATPACADRSAAAAAMNRRPRQYTWKTMLCECNEWEQVLQIQEMLRRAGIDSWQEGAGASNWDLRYPRILVAADQLDEARAVLARPVPQDVIDESRRTVPDYEPPRCPGCRAHNPVLESATPVNRWQCAACGRQWSDPPDPAGTEPPEFGS
jgi:hypothetical protein